MVQKLTKNLLCHPPSTMMKKMVQNWSNHVNCSPSTWTHSVLANGENFWKIDSSIKTLQILVKQHIYSQIAAKLQSFWARSELFVPRSRTNHPLCSKCCWTLKQCDTRSNQVSQHVAILHSKLFKCILSTGPHFYYRLWEIKTSSFFQPSVWMEINQAKGAEMPARRLLLRLWWNRGSSHLSSCQRGEIEASHSCWNILFYAFLAGSSVGAFITESNPEE